MASRVSPPDLLCRHPEPVVASKVEETLQLVRGGDPHPQVRVSIPQKVQASSARTKSLQQCYLCGGCSDLCQVKVCSSVLIKEDEIFLLGCTWDALRYFEFKRSEIMVLMVCLRSLGEEERTLSRKD